MTENKSSLGLYFSSLLSVVAMVFFAVYFMFIVLGVGDVGLGKLIENQGVICLILAAVVLVPIAMVVYFKRAQEADVLYHINRSVTAYVAAFLMFFYGYSKVYQKFFDITYLTQDSKVSDISSFSLTWYYFGRNNVQELFIGLLEIVPAILLLFRRTRFAGVILLLPVAGNVMLVNIFNRISGITFPVSVLICIIDLFLIYGYRKPILEFLKKMTGAESIKYDGFLKIARVIFKTLILGTTLYCFVAPIAAKMLKSSPNFDQRNKFMGGFELQSLDVNGQPVLLDSVGFVYYRDIYLEPQKRWNTVRTFNKDLQPVAITIDWNHNNDSVRTWVKLTSDVSKDAVDSSTIFSGVYHLSGDTLVVSGTQYGKAINAVYKKKKLNDYNWFW